jgi:hypothetical protein
LTQGTAENKNGNPMAAVCYEQMLMVSAVDHFFHGRLGLTDSLLNFTFAFLDRAFGDQLVVSDSFTCGLFDVANGFIGSAFDFV